jgi:hypothetical protein
MDYNTQLQLNALLQEFLEEGDTFDSEKAKQFRDLIPNMALQKYTVSAEATIPSAGFKGRTNTGHDENLDEEKKKLSYTNKEPGIWVGGYELLRSDKEGETIIIIQDRFADTRPEAPELYSIEFSGGEPTALFKSETWVLNLFILKITKQKMVPWKKPA